MPKQSSTAEFGPNLKSLECFRTIIEQGSATAAARHLQLTQPAISRQLRLLEEATGFELFKRAKRNRLAPFTLVNAPPITTLPSVCRTSVVTAPFGPEPMLNVLSIVPLGVTRAR